MSEGRAKRVSEYVTLVGVMGDSAARSVMSADCREEPCHCGRPVKYGFDGDPAHHRGMCEDCDLVRRDAYPGECGPVRKPESYTGGQARWKDRP